jgi:hypothetical protein
MPSNEYRAEARGLGMPGYMDESSHGHYIPSQARGQNMPVRMNQRDQRDRDIGPT